MALLVYILAYPLLWLISRMPFRILYVLSDGFYVILYYVIGYRKKTVRNNLAITLPHLSGKELRRIEKASYRHFCDILLEMVKTLSMSKKEIDQRFVITNPETYYQVEKSNKSIIVLCAHYATYEWVVAVNNHIHFKGYGIYKKINNPYFDQLIKKIRARFKTELIHIHETGKIIKSNEQKNIRASYGFVADQSPQLKKRVHWDHFMGLEVPVYTGAEILDKRFDMNVMFLKTEKVKRGHYRATFEIITTEPRSVPDYEITRVFLDKVEKQIHQDPEFYLWTHKRWKHHGKKLAVQNQSK